MTPSEINKYQEQFKVKRIEWENQQKAKTNVEIGGAKAKLLLAENSESLHSVPLVLDKGKSVQTISTELASSRKIKGSFYASMRDVDRALNSESMFILLIFQEALFTTDELPSDLPLQPLDMKVRP